ncbi:hypothetical protein EDB80DRAFT_279210 [Ilyonectria destructans]|nr:hypothetical protein EDB80DRAFT_279210 [Ilyonectria destructans]
MSQSTRDAAGQGDKFVKPCVMLIDGMDGPMFGGKGLVVGSPMGLDIVSQKTAVAGPFGSRAPPWMGFNLTIPLGALNHTPHMFNRLYRFEVMPGLVARLDEHTIDVQFPRGQIVSTIYPLDSTIRGKFTGDGDMTVVEVCLKDGADLYMFGKGMPFRTRFHPIMAFFTANEPVVGGKTIADILNQRKFTFIVSAPESVVAAEWDEAKLSP